MASASSSGLRVAEPFGSEEGVVKRRDEVLLAIPTRDRRCLDVLETQTHKEVLDLDLGLKDIQVVFYDWFVSCISTCE